MPRSEKSLIAPAIFGLIFTSFGLGMVGHEWLADRYAQRASEQTHKSIAQDHRDNSEQNTFATYPDVQMGSCYQARNHDTADLCAQWRAAFAAEKAARASEQTVLISILSLLLSSFGLIALIVTIKQGRDGIANAAEANSISRSVGEKQLRAYVSIAPYDLIIKNGGVKGIDVEVKLMNGGATPAYAAAYSGSVWMCQREVAEEVLRNVEKIDVVGERPWMVIHSNAELEGKISSDVSFTPDEINALRTGAIDLYAYGSVEYRDVFDHPQVTNFCYRMVRLNNEHSVGSQSNGPTKGRWEQTTFLNDAT